MRIGGTPDFSCKVRVIAKGSMKLMPRLDIKIKNQANIAPTKKLQQSFTEYQVAGNSELQLKVSSP